MAHGRIVKRGERGKVGGLDHDVEDARRIGAALVSHGVPWDRAPLERGEAHFVSLELVALLFQPVEQIGRDVAVVKQRLGVSP